MQYDGHTAMGIMSCRSRVTRSTPSSAFPHIQRSRSLCHRVNYPIRTASSLIPPLQSVASVSTPRSDTARIAKPNPAAHLRSIHNGHNRKQNLAFSHSKAVTATAQSQASAEMTQNTGDLTKLKAHWCDSIPL